MDKDFCHFCGKRLVTENEVPLSDKKAMQKAAKNYGEWSRYSGKIGKAYICRDCCRDLRFLLA